MARELTVTACAQTQAATPDSALAVHLPVLLVGLRWLFDTEQPTGAVQCPAGDSLLSVGGRGFRFIPQGRDGRAALGIAVTTGNADDRIGGHEVAGFIDLLEGMGEEVIAVEAVVPGSFYTLTLERGVHPSMRNAVAGYRAAYLGQAGAAALFGHERLPQAVSAISVSDLHRQVLEGGSAAATKQVPTPAAVQMLDVFGSPTSAFSTAADRRQLAMQS